jgi:hypothetical protein
MESPEEDEVQIIPLKADAVMCELTGCERPARFLLKYRAAFCERIVKNTRTRGVFRGPEDYALNTKGDIHT